MATGHRDFLETLENGVSVRAYCLSEWRKACAWRPAMSKTWGKLGWFLQPFHCGNKRLTYMEFRNVIFYMKFDQGIASRHSDKILPGTCETYRCVGGCL